MKKFYLHFLFLLLSILAKAQDNCSNPVRIHLCPDTTLLNQTNVGMLNDAPAYINITGNDIVYEISVPVSAMRLYVSLLNANSWIRGTLLRDSCTGPVMTAMYMYSGSNYTFNVGGSSKYYLWLDSYNAFNANISFGADTSSTYINHPDTQGNFQLDTSGCATPSFFPNKKYYQVKFNNVIQTNPMTLAPLYVPGSLCIATFIRNLTGDEGVKRFTFSFGTGYSNISMPDTIPGFYNAGYWLKTNTGFNSFTYTFVDAAYIGRGDFTGTPNSCLRYEFCFTLTPNSNSPAITNINVLFSTDGYGAAFSGYTYSGCCPSGYLNCHGSGGGGGSSGVNSFGFGMNDPGGVALPVGLIDFSVKPKGNSVFAEWKTESEINNDHFTLERSADNEQWTEVKKVQGAGNSSIINIYSATDDYPLKGISYYRLKQIDFDGKETIFPSEVIDMNDRLQVNVYPNPAREYINVSSPSNENLKVDFYNQQGMLVHLPESGSAWDHHLNTSEIPDGIYILLISDEAGKTERRMISVLKN